MKSPKNRVLSIVLLAFATCLVASCGGAQKKEDRGQTLEEYERNTPPPDDPCYGPGGEPIECTTNAECCKGMVCTEDPERSQVLKYCLQG